ncbi:transforming acidic coiled-coil-containing protein 1-like, partial [Centrocercus urophasianus]|uniref:transforming acidic coiled-coil-containing protein 1-like n=1 Tax=Centrocercus urophasianus TaxID=9002 RepID=UPI001C64E340
MAFSAWQLLSPVQWARWTWSAVRGGGGPDGEDGGVGGDAEEEIKSLGFSSDSEGNYETPEAETPTCSALKEPSELQPEAGTRGFSGHGELQGGEQHHEEEAQPEVGASPAHMGTKSGPEDSAVTQLPVEARPPVPHVGAAGCELVMSGGDTADDGLGLTEPERDALVQESSPCQLQKGKLPSQGSKGGESTEPAPSEEPSVPLASDPEQYKEADGSVMAEGCTLQSCPPAPHCLQLSEPEGHLGPQPPGQLPKAEVDATEGGDGVETRRASPRRASRIPASKLTPKRHRRPIEDTEKGSYQFDPNNFDSVDPFKPTKTLTSTTDCCPTADNSLNEILESQTLEDELGKSRGSPQKAKSRLITSSCKVKQYETPALVLDGCTQDEGTLISEIPDIAARDGRATDEEKLASTSCTQKAAGLEKKGEPEDDLEYFECSNVPVLAVKPGVETGFEEISKHTDKDRSVAFPVSAACFPLSAHLGLALLGLLHG